MLFFNDMDPAFIVMMHRIGPFLCSRYICAAVKRRMLFLNHYFPHAFVTTICFL